MSVSDFDTFCKKKVYFSPISCSHAERSPNEETGRKAMSGTAPGQSSGGCRVGGGAVSVPIEGNTLRRRLRREVESLHHHFSGGVLTLGKVLYCGY